MKIKKKELLDLLNDGVTVSEIAEKYKLSILTIGWYLNKYDIPHAGIDIYSLRGSTPIMCSKDGEEIVFATIKETASFLSVADSSITYNINKNKKINGYSLEKLDKDQFAKEILWNIDSKPIVKKATKEKVSISDIKKQRINHYKEELEAVFRRLGYYDNKKLFSIKQSLYPYGSKTN